jgi:DNA-binding IclR family transcriptional regulator
MQAAPILAKLPTDRQSAILDLISEVRVTWRRKRASAELLAEQIGCSARTIRRELSTLTLRGFVEWDTRQGLDLAPGIVFAGDID